MILNTQYHFLFYLIDKMNNKGKNNPNYKHGKTLKIKFCNCGKKLGKHAVFYNTKRCRSCAIKHKWTLKNFRNILTELAKNRIGKLNSNFKSGQYSGIRRCKVKGCNNLVIKRGTRCRFHSRQYQGNKMKGKNNPNWKKGISKFPYSFIFDNYLKEQIRKRDNYKCQKCGKLEKELIGFHKKLSIHHIDYNKKNCKKSNLITLCNRCNSKVNFQRRFWKNYFQKIVKEKI